MSATRVYQVTFDGGQRIVEAESFRDAIIEWNAAMRREFEDQPNNGGWTGYDDPESVTCINDEPVIRREQPEVGVGASEHLVDAGREVPAPAADQASRESPLSARSPRTSTPGEPEARAQGEGEGEQ